MENNFFLSRNSAPHYGDRIEFATHPNRSLEIPAAIELAAWLVFLIDDDEAVGKLIMDLRGERHPADQVTNSPQPPQEQPRQLEPTTPTPTDAGTAEPVQISSVPADNANNLVPSGEVVPNGANAGI